MAVRRALLRWAGGALLAGVAIAVIPAQAGEVTAESAEGRVPADFAWAVVDACADIHAPEFVAGHTLRPSGSPAIDLYIVQSDGQWIGPVSRAFTEHGAVQDCVDSFEFESPIMGLQNPEAPHFAIAAEWNLQFTEPCVAAHGVPSEGVASESPLGRVYSALRAGTITIDRAIEIRRACPPVPEFLGGLGIGW